jgi:hypothetical protein
MKKHIVVLLLLSVSCSYFDQEKQKKSVSSLSSEVKTFKKEFNAIKIDSISDLKLSTYEVERRIKQNYYSDTIDISFGQKMDDFKRMRRMLGPLGKEQARVKNSINEELLQLEKLQSDISKGYGKRESYNEYIQFEKNKVNQIKVLYTEYVKMRAQFLEMYTALYFELYTFSKSIEDKP